MDRASLEASGGGSSTQPSPTMAPLRAAAAWLAGLAGLAAPAPTPPLPFPDRMVL